MLRERLDKSDVKSLVRGLGMSALAIDFANVDYSLGSVVVDANERRIWTKDGKRITVCGVGNGVIVSMGKNPDPERPTEALN